MKKRRILLGLALASLFTFSLSACGDDENKTVDPTPSTDNTGTDTTPATDNTGTDTTPATTEKVKVQYYKVIEGESPAEITAAKQEINKGATTTKPESALALADYKIVDYYTSAGCTDVFDFTKAINADTKVYVKYVELSKYDEIVASTNNVVAFDFNTTTTVSKVSNLEFDSTTNEASIKTNSDAIKVQNDVLTFGDVNGNAIIDFGKRLDSSAVYSIYYEMTFRAVENAGGSIAQLNGTTGSSYTNVFELRNNKGTLDYNAEGKGATASSIKITENSTIKVLIELDTADSKLTVNVNDTKIYEAQTNIVGINGLKFQQDIGKAKFDVDNVAVSFEAKNAGELVTAKKAAREAVNSYLKGEDYAALNETVKTLVDSKAAAIMKAIDDATEASVVNAKATEWSTFVAADKPIVTVKAYTAASTPLTGATDYKVAVVAGEAFDKTAVSFDGYVIRGFYTAADLATEYTATTVTAETTIYAKVAVAQKYVLKADSSSATDIANGDVVAEDTVVTVKLVGLVGTVAADKSSATANDNSGLTFTKAWLPAGDTKVDTKYFELKTTETIAVTIYFTCTNSSFTTTDQSKGGELQIDGTQVTTVAGNKSNTVAYAYTFTATANQAYKINCSSNRLALFAVSYSK